MKKALFLDRDGVLNKLIKKNNNEYRPPWKIEEIIIFNNAYELIKKSKKLNLIPIVITNQPDIGRGDIPYENAFKINKIIMDSLKIDKFYICPHGTDHECNCRKPKPGMLLKAAKEYKINLDHSIMVGDRKKDVLAGREAGCKTIYLGKESIGIEDFHVKNHEELIKQILKISNL